MYTFKCKRTHTKTTNENIYMYTHAHAHAIYACIETSELSEQMKKTKYNKYEQQLNSHVFFTNTSATNSSMFQMMNNKRNGNESVEMSDTYRARARTMTM